MKLPKFFADCMSLNFTVECVACHNKWEISYFTNVNSVIINCPNCDQKLKIELAIHITKEV